MKKLDLNAYGVSEMNAAELRETDGGIWAVVAVIAAVTIIDAIFDIDWLATPADAFRKLL